MTFALTGGGGLIFLDEQLIGCVKSGQGGKGTKICASYLSLPLNDYFAVASMTGRKSL